MTMNVDQLRANMAANPTVADIWAMLVAEADRLGLGHNGGSRYISQGGSRYFSCGLQRGEFWSDDVKIRVSNHGGGFRNERDLHLTTLQDPAELQANIDTALERMRALAETGV